MTRTIRVQRCPAERIARIENQRIQGWHRCELPIGHSEAHLAVGQKWRFADGSWSGLPDDHPDFVAFVEVPWDRSMGGDAS